MITLDNKMEVFSKIVLDKVKKEYNDSMQALDKHHERLKAEKQDALEQQGRDFAREMRQRAVIEKKKIVSRARGQARKNILVKKEELFYQLKGSIIEEIGQYCETVQYQLFLKERIAQYQEELTLLKGEIIVSCRNRDRGNIESALTDAGVDVPMTFVDDEEILGGLSLVDHIHGIKINMTIDSVIEENTVYIGSLIHDLLREAGESDE